jgi:hypothetical protein
LSTQQNWFLFRPIYIFQGLTKWSTQTAWNTANAAVVINTPVLLDVTPPPLASLTINSEFIFDNKDLQLTTGWIRVNSTGSFIAGSTETNCQIDKKIIVTFTGFKKKFNSKI